MKRAQIDRRLPRSGGPFAIPFTRSDYWYCSQISQSFPLVIHFLVNNVPLLFLVSLYLLINLNGHSHSLFFDSLLSIAILSSALDIKLLIRTIPPFTHLSSFLFHSSRLCQSVISVHFHLQFHVSPLFLSFFLLIYKAALI